MWMHQHFSGVALTATTLVVAAAFQPPSTFRGIRSHAIPPLRQDRQKLSAHLDGDLINHIGSSFDGLYHSFTNNAPPSTVQNYLGQVSDFSFAVAAVDSKYDLSGFQRTVGSTLTAFGEAIGSRQFITVMCLAVSVFLGEDQRQMGLEDAKLETDGRIEELTKELQAVSKEDSRNVEEVKALNQQMQYLEEQVLELTVAAEKVTMELSKEKELLLYNQPSEAPVAVSKIVAETAHTDGPPQEATKAAPSKVKGANARASSEKTTATKKKTKTAARKKLKRSKKTAQPDEGAKLETKTNKRNIVVEGTSLDWGSLTQSTLKRKTVKELVGYLNDKGVACTDGKGKRLKKDLLVALVLSK